MQYLCYMYIYIIIYGLKYVVLFLKGQNWKKKIGEKVQSRIRVEERYIDTAQESDDEQGPAQEGGLWDYWLFLALFYFISYFFILSGLRM